MHTQLQHIKSVNKRIYLLLIFLCVLLCTTKISAQENNTILKIQNRRLASIQTTSREKQGSALQNKIIEKNE
jgi:hypothetical protein